MVAGKYPHESSEWRFSLRNGGARLHESLILAFDTFKVSLGSIGPSGISCAESAEEAGAEAGTRVPEVEVRSPDPYLSA
jgi:hypothetical protein